MMNANNFRIATSVLSKNVSKVGATAYKPSFAAFRSFSSGATLSDDEDRALFHKWNDALATLDSHTVASRYVKSPVLLPTVSNKPRTDYASVKDYFDAFLKMKPQGVIVESYVNKGSDWCSDTGIYDFTLRETGAKVLARYSFVYTLEDGEWKIYHHHSSAMPEKTA